MRAQVLDDSTCKVTRQLVDEKAAEWAERGVKCEVVRRTNRQGYKAGALKDVSAAAPRCARCAVPVHGSLFFYHAVGAADHCCEDATQSAMQKGLLPWEHASCAEAFPYMCVWCSPSASTLLSC